jgi:DNA-binding response OmpR family regulator
MTERAGPAGDTAPAACVLVVDDDAQVRAAIRWALEDEGLTVLTAADGREAVDLAIRQRPDLVVLDLTLPEVHGDEVARRLRAARAGPLPILVITADGQAPAKAEQVGAYAFVRKPFRIEDLLDAVRAGLPAAEP